MSPELNPELVSLLQRNDKQAKRQVFELYYGKLAAIALRYCKSQTQAEEVLNLAFNNCLTKLQHLRSDPSFDLGTFLEKEFIAECVSYIREIRSEYYVASTVYASETTTKSYDLFANNELIDFRKIDNDVLIKSLQQLVPSQRLIFNLHVIDSYSLNNAATLLESSEATAKSNLEKARFNLQKNVEKCLNNAKYEQSL